MKSPIYDELGRLTDGGDSTRGSCLDTTKSTANHLTPLCSQNGCCLVFGVIFLVAANIAVLDVMFSLLNHLHYWLWGAP